MQTAKRPYRPWSARERQAVRDHYGPLSRDPWPTARIAAELGRTAEDVRAAAKRYGRAWRGVGRLSRRALRRLHGLGWSDGRIAWQLGVARETVQRVRVQLGLPAVGRSWGWHRRTRNPDRRPR